MPSIYIWNSIWTIPLIEWLVDKYREHGFWGCFKDFKRQTTISDTEDARDRKIIEKEI